MNHHEGQREFTRAPVGIRATLNAPNEAPRAGVATQVSLNGAFVELADPLSEGTPCDVVLLLEGSDEELAVRARGKIVRTEEAGVALHFDEIVGAESLRHLRFLVLYNASKTSQVEGEFKSHSGILRPIKGLEGAQ